MRSGDSYSIHSKCAWWSFHPQKIQRVSSRSNEKEWEGASLILSQTRLSAVVLRLTSPHCGVDVILLVSTIWKDHFVLCHSKRLSYTVMAYRVFEESPSVKKNWKFSVRERVPKVWEQRHCLASPVCCIRGELTSAKCSPQDCVFPHIATIYPVTPDVCGRYFIVRTKVFLTQRATDKQTVIKVCQSWFSWSWDMKWSL